MDKLKLTGAIIAAAAGVIFAAQPLIADNTSAAQVKCVGGNSCKGQSACQSARNSCKGQNSCKGKGWIMTSSAQDCTEHGGKVDNSAEK